MKPKRDNTLQSRFGFQDHELTTPRHDEIMLWLDAEADRIVAEIEAEPCLGLWKDSLDEAKSQWALSVGERIQELKTVVMGTTPEEVMRKRELCSKKEAELVSLKANPPGICEFPGLKVKRTWELPIMSGSFMVGFVDMVFDVFAPLALVNNTGLKAHWLPSGSLGRVGRFAFEVKPSISSLGEVIRQIRMYQQYLPGVSFSIVCPDDRFKPALESQGIGFLLCP